MSSSSSPNEIFQQLGADLQAIAQLSLKLKNLERPIAPQRATPAKITVRGESTSLEDQKLYEEECYQFDKTKDEIQFEVHYNGSRMIGKVEQLARHWMQLQEKSQESHHSLQELKKEHEVLKAKIEMLEEEKRLGPIRGSELFQQVLKGDLEEARKVTLGGHRSAEEYKISSSSSSYRNKQEVGGSCKYVLGGSGAGQQLVGTSHVCGMACQHQTDGKGEGQCPHKSVLASRIIDKTFDEHKQILRDQLKAAQEQLERFKNGEVYKAYQREIDAQKQLLKEKNHEIEELRNKLVEEMTRRSSLLRNRDAVEVVPNMSTTAEGRLYPLQSMQVRRLLQYALAQSELAQFGLTYQFQTVLEDFIAVSTSSSSTCTTDDVTSVIHLPQHDDLLHQPIAEANRPPNTGSINRPLSRHRLQAMTILPSENTTSAASLAVMAGELKMNMEPKKRNDQSHGVKQDAKTVYPSDPSSIYKAKLFQRGGKDNAPISPRAPFLK